MKIQMWKAVAVAIASMVFVACSENTNEPSGEGTLEVKTAMSNPTVSMKAYKGIAAVQGGSIVDSIHVDSVRILLKRIKLHRSNDDTMSGGKDVKIGPAVIHFTNDTAAAVSLVFRESIPTGLYRKMKLEMHRFTPTEAEGYITDPEFGPFAYPERLTIIINGTVYANGASRAFQFEDDWTENMWILFDPELEVGTDQTNLTWEFDAAKVFWKAGALLDPDDDHHKGDIGDGLRKCWRIFKRNH
jgi:hypothetical protein